MDNNLNMKKVIQLKPKQIFMLEKTQREKQNLKNLYAQVEEKEQSFLQLIIEANDVKEDVLNCEIQGDNLLLTFKDEEKLEDKVNP